MPPESNIDPLLLQNDEQIELLKELTSTQEQQLVQGDEISTTLSEIATDAEYALLQRDEIKEALEDVVKAVKNIPKVEIPEAKEPLEEVSVKNFPDVQRVEITNHPAEKDDTKQVELLEGILEEVKKKEEYDYDIEITPELKKELKGERGDKGDKGEQGEQGEQGIPGKDAEIVDFEAIKIDYKQVVNRPDVEAIVRKYHQASKTTSFKELDDVDLTQLPVVDGKYVFNSAEETFESVLRNLKSYQADYTYSNGKITFVLYTIGTESITETVNYSGDTITSIVLSGDTPSGISLTKSFNYTGTNISSFTYS